MAQLQPHRRLPVSSAALVTIVLAAALLHEFQLSSSSLLSLSSSSSLSLGVSAQTVAPSNSTGGCYFLLGRWSVVNSTTSANATNMEFTKCSSGTLVFTGSRVFQFSMFCNATDDPNVFTIDLVYTSAPSGNSTSVGRRSYGILNITNTLVNGGNPTAYNTDSFVIVIASTAMNARPDLTQQTLPNVYTRMEFTGSTRRDGNELATYASICSGATNVAVGPAVYTLHFDILNALFTSTTMVLQSSQGPELTIFDALATSRTLTYFNVISAVDYTFTGITFQNSIQSVFQLDGTATLRLNNCIVRSNSALTPVSAKSASSAATIIVSQSRFFNNTVAASSGVFFLRNTMSAVITGSVFDNNTAIQNAGVATVNDNASILFNFCSFYRSRAGTSTTAQFGGIINSASNANITMLNSYIEDTLAPTGGAVALGGSASFTAVNLTVVKSFAFRTSGFLSTQTGNVFRITNSSFIGGGALGSGSGFCAIAGAGYGFITNTVISNYTSTWTGGVITASASNAIPVTNVLTITNSSFLNNYGVFGGVFVGNWDRIISCTDCLFVNNRAELGGISYLQDTSQVIFNNARFINNEALSGGCFYTLNSGSVLLNASFVQSNSAEDIGGAFALTLQSSLTAVKTVFDSNIAIELGGIGSVSDDATATLTDCIFQNSLSRDAGGAFVTRALATLTISNGTFINNRAFGDGGSIRASGSSKLSVDSSSFTGSNAQRGGAIALVGYSSLNLTNSTINGNNATSNGGGLVLLDSTSARVENTLFSNNMATPVVFSSLASALSLGALSSSINLLGDTAGGGALYLSVTSTLTCTGCRVTSNVAYGGFGGGLLIVSASSSPRAKYAQQTDVFGDHNSITSLTATLTNCTISGNTASFDGGAVTIQGGRVTLSQVNMTQNSAGRNGGAISYFVRDNEPSQLTMSALNFVFDNTASGVGGGAYFSEGSTVNSTIYISSTAYWFGNTATSGGAYYLQSSGSTPVWQNATNIPSQVFSNNATVYGAVSASPPVAVSFVPGANLPASMSLKPGGIIPSATFQLLDTFGSVVAISDGSIQYALFDSNGFSVPSAIAQLGGVSRRSVLQGQAVFSGVTVFGLPGSYTLRVTYVPSTASSISASSVTFAAYALTVAPCSGDYVLIYSDATGLSTCYSVFPMSMALRYTFLGIAILGEILCLILLTFVITQRNAPPIRASSPKFMALVIFGCMLAFALVGTMIPQATDLSCTVNIWLGHCAFFLAFGALFFKTYRIVIIFNNKKLKKQLTRTSDQFLLSMVSLILGVLIIYLIVWTTVDRHRQTLDIDATAVEVSYLCGSRSNLWELALYVAEALLLLFGVVLAYKSRKAPTKWNESKFLAFAIWNIVAIVIIILPLNYIVDANNPDTQFLVTCVGVFLATFGTLILSIGHKVYTVLSKAEVEDSSHDANPKESSSPSHSQFSTTMAIELGGEKSRQAFSRLESELQAKTQEAEKAAAENKALTQRVRDLEAKVTLLLMDVAEAKRMATSTTRLSAGDSHSRMPVLHDY